MTEPLGEVDLAELDAIEPPRAEKEPFLHSVTRQTPWCLYSVMFHVLIVVLIGLVPIIAANSGDHEQVLVLVDPGSPAETEFYGGSTHAVPLGTASRRDAAPMGPVAVQPDCSWPTPATPMNDLFDHSDHIIDEDQPNNSSIASSPAYKTLMAREADELRPISTETCPGALPRTIGAESGSPGAAAHARLSLKSLIRLLFKAPLSNLRDGIPAWIGHNATK